MLLTRGADVQVKPRRVLNYTRSRVDVIATWFDRSELLDVRVSHPCAPTYVVRAAAEPGYTARVGEAAKEGKEVYQVMAHGCLLLSIKGERAAAPGRAEEGQGRGLPFGRPLRAVRCGWGPGSLTNT